MKIKRFQRLTSIVVLFATVGFLFSTGVPNALASPGIGATNIPGVPAVDHTARLGPVGTAGAAFDNVVVRAYSPLDFPGTVAVPGFNAISIGTTPPDCTFNDHPEAAGKFYDLFATDTDLITPGNQPGPALLDLAMSESALVRFGDGGFAEPDDIGQLDSTQAGPLFWRQDTGEGSQADSTDIIDELVTIPDNGRVYAYVVCGTEVPPVGTPTLTAQTGKFETQLLVGGFEIPISPVALLTAGLLSPTIALPVIGAVVGITGLTITKLRNKKQ